MILLWVGYWLRVSCCGLGCLVVVIGVWLIALVVMLYLMVWFDCCAVCWFSFGLTFCCVIWCLGFVLIRLLLFDLIRVCCCLVLGLFSVSLVWPCGCWLFAVCWFDGRYRWF